jgi:hypothetical protein
VFVAALHASSLNGPAMLEPHYWRDRRINSVYRRSGAVTKVAERVRRG